MRTEPSVRRRAAELAQRRPRRSPAELAAGILFAVAAVLAAAILVGTVAGVASGSRQKKLNRELAEASLPPGKAVFEAIGTLRAATADPKPAIVVATLAFPYDPADRPFREELERKAGALKAAAAAYFSRAKAAELAPAFEGGVKAALRDTLNGLLSLGRIDEIWLSDFSVIQ